MRDLVQRLRDLIRQRGVVVLGLRLEVVRRARRGGVAVACGPSPRDRRPDIDELQRRIGRGCGRHREHDAVADARELAVADERRAVLQEHAEQRRVVGSRRARARTTSSATSTPANVLLRMKFQA